MDFCCRYGIIKYKRYLAKRKKKGIKKAPAFDRRDKDKNDRISIQDFKTHFVQTYDQ